MTMRKYLSFLAAACMFVGGACAADDGDEAEVKMPQLCIERNQAGTYKPDASLAAAFESFHTRLEAMLANSRKVTVKTKDALDKAFDGGVYICNYEIISGKPTGIVDPVSGCPEYLIGVSLKANDFATQEVVAVLTGTFEFRARAQIPEEIVGITIRQLANVIIAGVAPIRILDVEEKTIEVDLGRELLKKGDLLKIYTIKKNGRRSMKPKAMAVVSETTPKTCYADIVSGQWSEDMKGVCVWSLPDDTDTGGQPGGTVVGSSGNVGAGVAAGAGGKVLEVRNFAAAATYTPKMKINGLEWRTTRQNNIIGTGLGLANAFNNRKHRHRNNVISSIVGQEDVTTVAPAASLKVSNCGEWVGPETVCGMLHPYSLPMMRTVICGAIQSRAGCSVIKRDERTDDAFRRQGQRLGDYYLEGTFISYEEWHQQTAAGVVATAKLSYTIRVVNRVTGVDVLNKAMDTMVQNVPFQVPQTRTMDGAVLSYQIDASGIVSPALDLNELFRAAGEQIGQELAGKL